MKRPYKATELLRATVDRNCRAVLLPDPDAPANSFRLVQILSPGEIYIGFEHTAPDEQAGGRDYVMAHVPAEIGVVAPFPILPEQTLYMMAARNQGANHASLVLATLIVQHWVVE